MKKYIYLILLLIGLLWLSEISATAEDRIALLKSQIASLEVQRSKINAEKQILVNQGDELSYKIEELKSQSDRGIGIIGRYKLSRNLRKAQNLSEKIELLDRNINDLDAQIKVRKVQLQREYENQINVLVQRVNNVSNVDEKRAILNKIKEYQSARDQLRSLEKQETDRINIADIEIKEYDSPKDIREKADLISDLAKKTDTRMSAIDSRIISLKNEIITRQKLGEFANEISFFGDRIARDEVTSEVASQSTTADDKKAKEATGGDSNNDANTLTTDTRSLTGEPKTTEGTTKTQEPTAGGTIKTPTLSVKKVMKSKGVSAEVSEIPQSSIEEKLKTLEQQRQALKKESESLREKAKSFRKKADDLEKSGSKTGETQGTKAKTQSQRNKTQSDDKSQKKR